MARTTLQDRNCGRLPWAEAFKHRQLLLPGDEQAVARYILAQTIAGYPIDRPTLLRIANSTLCRRAEAGEQGLPEAVGKNWPTNSYRRFPSLMHERTKVLERLRASGNVEERVLHWMGFYKEMTMMPPVPLELFHNMDETGIQQGVQNTAGCIVNRDIYNRIRKSSENRENATVIGCISASGQVLSPMVILGVKTHGSEWHSEERRGAALWHSATSPYGYTDNALGLEWLEKVSHPRNIAAVAGRRRYLICDRHASHESPDFLSFAFKHKIYLLRLPAHTSHRTQPLDVGCFSP